MTNKRQKATKVKSKRDELNLLKNSQYSWNSSLEEAFEFCWSLIAEEHKTLPWWTNSHWTDVYSVNYVSIVLRHFHESAVAEGQRSSLERP